MGKGIRGLFSGWMKKEREKEQKTEEYWNHTGRDSNTERSIQCPGCGAINTIVGDSKCEYCQTPLIYTADRTDVINKDVAQTGSGTAKEYTLTTGFYTAGIDIPVGRSKAIAISGSGHLFTSDDEMSEIFGTEKGDVSSFQGLKLPKDVALVVSGKLTVKLVYQVIEQGCLGRTFDRSGAVEISTGNHLVGTDFKAGIYNIVAVSGSGYISVDDYEIGETLGIDDEDVHEISNVYLAEGVELSLTGDVLAKLTPAMA